MQIYLETSSPRQANNVPKLPGVNYVAKNWALVVMLKACHWLISRALCRSNTRSSSECKINRFLAKFAHKIPIKSAGFYQLFFGEFSHKNFCVSKAWKPPSLWPILIYFEVRSKPSLITVFCMDPHLPNKLFVTKYCFLILGDESVFFLIISLFFVFLNIFFILCYFVIINFYKNYVILIILFN